MEKPFISIIIPYFNDNLYIKNAVLSALHQTYSNIEVILVDDGSNEENKKILEEIRPLISQLIIQENLGLSAARNRGVNSAKGEFIVVLDSDDYFEPTFCEKAIEILLKEPQAKLVTCFCNRFTNKGLQDIFKPRGGDVINFLLENSALGNSMFRKTEFKEIGGYDEKMRCGYEDWEFYIRLLEGGGYAYVIEEPLFNYRQKKESLRLSANKIKFDLLRFIILKNSEIYKANFENFADQLLNRLENHEKQTERNTQKIEYKLGHKFLQPMRYFKMKVKTITSHKFLRYF